MRREDMTGRSTRGFTLIELLIVMVIIGIIISLILVAATDGIRRAEERATQSLIAKLDSALTDRMEGLISVHPDATGVLVPIMPATVPPTATAFPAYSHLGLALICDSSAGVTSIGANPALASIHQRAFLQRAQVIAQYDYIKAELPDVFVFVTPKGGWPTTQKGAVGIYPVNFSMQSTFNPFATANNFPNANYWLPMGATSLGQTTGINGASYSAAAGIAKNLGAAPQGYDGTDNDGDGNIDDMGEWYTGLSQDQINNIVANIGRHLAATADGIESSHHRTARSEMLYALLVEGQGPLGSSFSADDFTQKEVQDTDGDGLPEFVDAWGQPLQFYRWPLYYHSDLQKGLWPGSSGAGPYDSQFEAREKDPLDPNNQLLSPAWWASLLNQGTGPTPPKGAEYSGSVMTFQTYFHALTEPLLDPASGITGYTATIQNFWDRGGPGGAFVQRRGYYSRFLVASSGPDMNLGIARCDVDYSQIDSTLTKGAVTSLGAGNLQLEGYGLQGDFTLANYLKGTLRNNFLLDAGNDDITNHNLQAPGGGTK